MRHIRNVLLTSLFIFGCATSRAEDTEAAKGDKAKLQGEWAMVSGERAGQPLPESVTSGATRVAKGDESTVTIQGQVLMKGTFTLDPAKSPKAIDMSVTDGPYAGSKQLGIYEFDGDKVKFCYAVAEKERPADFTTKAGDGRTMTVWKRAKK